MTKTTQRVIIKGNKEGLHFKMDSDCSFHELIDELDSKLKSSHAQFLQGPLTHVFLSLGTRYLNHKQKEDIKKRIERSGNLLVKEFISEVISIQEAEEYILSTKLRIEVGMVRSGQVLECDQDLLILGDVNPGGWVISNGNIYVMGALKGIAHAGKMGAKDRVIVASVMEPTQLRIADIIYEPQSINEERTHLMFAYLQNEQIGLERIQLIKSLRPEIGENILKGF